MLSLSLGLSLTAPRRAGGGVAPAPVSALFMGQSEMEYLFNTGGFYRVIDQPTPGDGNVIVFTQNGDGVAPVRTVVNATTVAAGAVNPAMAALSAFLAYARPGRTFVIGDGCKAGTGRPDLYDDADTDRLWSDLTAVVDAMEAETGAPVQSVVEMWFANDAGLFGSFINNFWPFYFGTDGAGAPFTLGTAGPQGQNVDHCLWDGTALAAEKGRGIFARSATAWRMLGFWPRWSGLPTAPTALTTYYDQGNNIVQPMRETMRGWAENALAQSVSMRVGPSCHVCKFGDEVGGSSNIHPSTLSPDGQILAVWPFAVELLRLAGRPMSEPLVVGIEGPDDGTYVDVLISLPNGGTLQTLRRLREADDPASPVDQWQPVTGFEVVRGGARTPIYRLDNAGQAAARRGTVVIQSEAETHGTYGRVGRVRITPEVAFDFGNQVSYLMGSAVAGLTDTDIWADLYLDMLIEHIPSLYDSSALYPFEGLAVAPYQADLTIPVAEPDFVAQSAVFDGSTYYQSSGISVVAGGSGIFSAWVKNDQATWNSPSITAFAIQVGSTAVLNLVTAGSGRMTFRINNNSTPDAVTSPVDTFAVGEWAHVLAAWGPGGATVWVNDVQIGTLTFATVDMDGQTVTRIGVGASAAPSSFWIGELGHVYLNLSETLDLSLPENRAKFSAGGAPVDLGADGSLPTGNAPDWYYDGAAPDWTNKGTAGNVPLTGTLTAGTAPEYTP